MVKRIVIFLLSILLLLSQVYVNATTRDYVPRNIDIERSSKNILVGSYIGGRSHLKPMLDLATVLIERGHNVRVLKFYVFFRSSLNSISLFDSFSSLGFVCFFNVGNIINIRKLYTVIRVSNCQTNYIGTCNTL